MRPAPIDAKAAARYPGFARVVVSGPTGDLTSDGRSPDQALAVEALHGRDANGWPLFVERWRLERGELEALQRGAEFELRLYVPQLVVHSLAVVELR